MRLVFALAFGAALLGPSRVFAEAGRGRQPYEGLWGTSAAACRDQDGTDRMEITAGRFFWYETRCQTQASQASGARSWALKLSCEGEGRRFGSRSRIVLPATGTLVMEGSPVGPTRRQTYVRCSR